MTGTSKRGLSMEKNSSLMNKFIEMRDGLKFLADKLNANAEKSLDLLELNENIAWADAVISDITRKQ